jgi:hypothetical protein
VAISRHTIINTLGVINGYEFSGGQPAKMKETTAYILVNKQTSFIQVVSEQIHSMNLCKKLALGRIDAPWRTLLLFWFAIRKWNYTTSSKLPVQDNRENNCRF